MYREKRRNKIIILILIGIICLMGVGYAAFKTSINITGTTDISSSWDIKIISADVTDTNGTGENVKNTYNDLSASLEANLYEKGDYVEYSIIVENKGTFDAKLETIGITNSNNEAVKITSSGLTKGQTLYQNTTATLKVKIEYNSSYEGDASGTSGEAKIDLDFVQNSGGTIEPEKNHLVTYDYSTNGGDSTTAENEYINEGESINLSYTATKEGYDFIGWNTNKDAQEGLKELTMGTSNVTLYAIFRTPDTTPPVIENVSTSSTTNSITVVVTASDEESGISKYEFKINDNDWIDNGTNNTYTFTGLTQDTGYDISVRVTNGVDLTAEEKVSESIKLTDNVVTSGDGLYKDSYEENVYTYRGINPNNYVMFNNELWRIISVNNKNNTIKIIIEDSIGNMEYDGIDNRMQGGYCNYSSSYGCNIWGSNSTLYSADINPITELAREINGTVYQLPSTEAELNRYLNTTYYNNLTKLAQNMVSKGEYKVGILGIESGQTLETDLNQVNFVNWNGNVSLIDITEYIRASVNVNCKSAKDYWNNDSCYNNSQNWLQNNTTYWTVSPYSDTNSNFVLYVYSRGDIGRDNANTLNGVRPVIVLSSTVDIVEGTGVKDNPYVLNNGSATKKLNTPTFIEEKNDFGKTVTITYPEGEGLTYEYQKDSGEWQTATQNQKVEFNNNGTLVARVSDGTNEEISTYVINVLPFGASGIIEKEEIVNNGDGLYKDDYQENIYTYRGGNPNNYITFNNELWRIISLDIDKNTIKIIRNSKLPDGWQFDVENNRYQNNGYCISDSCNIWGSIDTLYDANMIPITSIGREVNGPEFQLPSYEAKLNIYLNNEYYNELNNLAKKMVISDVYKVGVLDSSDNQETKVDLEQVSSVKWKGKVGLIDATEYVRASTNDNCTGAYAYYKYGDDACYNNSKNHNWMYDNYFNWWTLSPYSSTTSTYVWAVTTLGYLSENGSNGKAYSVRPVVTLSGEVKITSGNGSSSQPYQLML